MAHHDHDDRDVTLALSEIHPDGSITYQAWPICGCTLDSLRERLGPPRMESRATAEPVVATGLAVAQIPGVEHRGEGL